jgi:hypothetical protein
MTQPGKVATNGQPDRECITGLAGRAGPLSWRNLLLVRFVMGGTQTMEADVGVGRGVAGS